MTPSTRIPALLFLALGTAACTDRVEPPASPTDATAASEAAAQVTGSPGKLFSIDYEIVGTPVVGSPVSIDLEISSALGDEPVDLAFRIPDDTALTMEAAQPRDLRRTPSADDRAIRERVTVIPQREGRLFVNVSASRADADRTLTSTISIPIHVGKVESSSPGQDEPQTGETGEATRETAAD